MIDTALPRPRHLARRCFAAMRAWVARWTQPTPLALAPGVAADATRSRADLLVENALLRHQRVVFSRAVKRPRLTAADRALLVLLAGRLRTWAGVLVIVRLRTVLRWHRQGFRLFWKRKSRSATSTPRIPRELRKLDIRVSKRTIRCHLRQARPPRPTGQAWATFPRNHAGAIWACDFLPITDVFFRPLHACFVVALGSRRVVHVGVTRHPTGAWVARQRREATPFDERPRFLIRDNDAKFGPCFDRLAAASGIRVLRTPVRAPQANAVCERVLGSVRRKCLGHLLVLGERQLARVLRAYVASFNGARPHQGLGQRLPYPAALALAGDRDGPVVARAILGGLHHGYQRAA